MYRVLKQEGRAKRAEFTTVHGTVQTPVFMNVGTQGAIKGALSAEDLERIRTQVELSNTYLLHLRPGDKLVTVVENTKLKRIIGVFTVKGYVGEEFVAEAVVTCMLNPQAR